MKADPSLRGRILKVYLQVLTKKAAFPTRRDMQRAGISRDKIRSHFGTLDELRKAAKEAAPEKFGNMVDREMLTPERLAEVRTTIKKYKRFVITTAVTGCSVDPKFYKSIKTYCAKNDALLLVLLCTDPASSAGWNLPPELITEALVFDEISLNSNIFLSTVKTSAKQINPITGLKRIGQREGSFIYASPKQMMEPVAVSSQKFPHVLMTTGAITSPNYKTFEYMSERTAYIADHDHTLGAIIVEIEDDNYFHFRQVQADARTGGIADLGVMYTPTGTKKYPPAQFVWGDIHVTETDPTAEQAWLEVIKATGARRVVLHDMFSGVSINHHEEKRKIRRAQLALEGKLSLEQELRANAHKLNELTAILDEVVISKSNHDEFLSRYLDEAKYVQDAHNKRISLQMALAMVDGVDPLKYAVEEIIGIKRPERVRWLTRDEDYKIAGIELGAHGDRGANGARGSLEAMENAYGSSVSGHAHTPRILRKAYQVGTSSYLKLSYNSGPSSWMHSSCLVYPNGSRQLINSINGKWRLK